MKLIDGLLQVTNMSIVLLIFWMTRSTSHYESSLVRGDLVKHSSAVEHSALGLGKFVELLLLAPIALGVIFTQIKLKKIRRKSG